MIIYICIIIISIYDDVYGRSAVKTIQIHSPSRLTHSNLEVQHTTTPGHGYLMGDGSHTRKKTPQQWTSHKHFPVHFFINHGQSLMSPAKTTKSCCVKERCESGTLLILTDFYLLVETGGTGSVDQLTFPRAFGERSLHQPHETPRTWE